MSDVRNSKACCFLINFIIVQTSTSYNTFMYLTLPIPERNSAGQRGGAVYIEECIEKFIEVEYLDGQDGWYELSFSLCGSKSGTVQSANASEGPKSS